MGTKYNKTLRNYKEVKMSTTYPTPIQILDSERTQETISGIRAVAISPSGLLYIAMPSVSGRMPAIGVAVNNALSGQFLIYSQLGSIQATSGLLNFSGYVGKTIWIARSGQLAQMSGSWLSGGYTSRDVWQRAGIALNSGGLRIHLELASTINNRMTIIALASGVAGGELPI